MTPCNPIRDTIEHPASKLVRQESGIAGYPIIHLQIRTKPTLISFFTEISNLSNKNTELPNNQADTIAYPAPKLMGQESGLIGYPIDTISEPAQAHFLYTGFLNLSDKELEFPDMLSETLLNIRPLNLLGKTRELADIQ